MQMIVCASCGKSSPSSQWQQPLQQGQDETEATAKCPVCGAGTMAVRAQLPDSNVRTSYGHIVLPAENI